MSKDSDFLPLKVGYMGPCVDLMHVPPCGPPGAVGAKGEIYAEKYLFQSGSFVPVYNPEHKKWYKAEIEITGSHWVEYTGIPGKAKVTRGPSRPPKPTLPPASICPVCGKSRAEFGMMGAGNDKKFLDHIRAHFVEDDATDVSEAHKAEIAAKDAELQGAEDMLKVAMERIEELTRENEALAAGEPVDKPLAQPSKPPKKAAPKKRGRKSKKKED